MRSRGPLHIEGRGAVSCFGLGHDRFIESIFANRSGIRPLDRLVGVDCLTSVAAEVPRAVHAEAPRSEDLPLHFAMHAASEALGGRRRHPDPGMLLVVASTKADLSGITTRDGNGLGSPHRLAERLATGLEWQGPVHAVSTACASGLSALAFAGREILAGAADCALVVGVDCLTPFILRGFSSLLALAPLACRPFDRERCGLSLGEGAGAILLSRRTDGAGGVALLGWGESNDANHVTGPSRDGSGLALAIRRALDHAGVPAAAVDYVHLHGTGTPFNDAMESKAVRQALDLVSGVPQPPASGSKAQIGHTLGAAGILESLVTVAALERQEAPANVGLRATDADSLALSAERIPLRHPAGSATTALKVAAGFGGINAALVFRRTP